MSEISRTLEQYHLDMPEKSDFTISLEVKQLPRSNRSAEILGSSPALDHYI